MTFPVGNGLELRYETSSDDGKFARYVGNENAEPADFAKLVEHRKYGAAGECLQYEEENLLLVAIWFPDRSKKRADGYLLCIDLTQMD